MGPFFDFFPSACAPDRNQILQAFSLTKTWLYGKVTVPLKRGLFFCAHFYKKKARAEREAKGSPHCLEEQKFIQKYGGAVNES